jgi:hypothetical protein
MDGRTEEVFKAHEKIREARTARSSKTSKNIEILTTEDDREGI